MQIFFWRNFIRRKKRELRYYYLLMLALSLRLLCHLCSIYVKKFWGEYLLHDEQICTVYVSKLMGMAPLPCCTSRWKLWRCACTSLKLPFSWSVCGCVRIYHIPSCTWDEQVLNRRSSLLVNNSITTHPDPLINRRATIDFSVQCQQYKSLSMLSHKHWM